MTKEDQIEALRLVVIRSTALPERCFITPNPSGANSWTQEMLAERHRKSMRDLEETSRSLKKFGTENF